MENQIETAENQIENKNMIPKKRSVKISVWDIACIILFAVGIVFLIFVFDAAIYYREIIILSAVAAMVIIFLCFISLTKFAAVKIAALVIAGLILAVGWYIYFRYIPKYEPLDACAIVKADPKYASITIEPQVYNDVAVYNLYKKGKTVNAVPDVTINSLYKIEDNPFNDIGYVLYVIKDGKVTALIGFDRATGKYEVICELKD